MIDHSQLHFSATEKDGDCHTVAFMARVHGFLLDEEARMAAQMAAACPHDQPIKTIKRTARSLRYTHRGKKLPGQIS